MSSNSGNQLGFQNLSISEIHPSKSNSNILSPPTQFPTQGGNFMPIHRSHSSDESKVKTPATQPNLFGDLAKSSFADLSPKK